MARRVYTSDKINVSFDASRCIHTARCLRGLPQVFDLDAKPWISPDSADPDDIAAAVEQCPSGALQYERLDGGEQEQADAPPFIQPLVNGPLMVRGDVRMIDAEGNVISDGVRMTLCRCGQSSNKPFCDNTHRKIGFTA